MGVSKARKSGVFVGGRPWPLVSPICRKCQGGPPTHFYNSKGLCNVCHKFERKNGGKWRWPDIPVMLRDASLKALQKNPLKWLRNNYTESHAQTIPAKFHELEAWRIIHVVACRWYGEEVFMDPLQPVDYNNLTWTMSTDAESEEHAPIYDVDRASKLRKQKAAAAKRARCKKDPTRFEHIRNIIRPMVKSLQVSGLDLPIPKVTITPSGWAALWNYSDVYLVISGDLHKGPSSVLLADTTGDEESIEFTYSPENFSLSWSAFSFVQTHPLEVATV